MVLHVSPDVFQVLRPLHAATRERLILLLSQRGRELQPLGGCCSRNSKCVVEVPPAVVPGVRRFCPGDSVRRMEVTLLLLVGQYNYYGGCRIGLLALALRERSIRLHHSVLDLPVTPAEVVWSCLNIQ
jgi:hypothetical protein